MNAVYVFDDKLVLTYNYQHGTQTISLDEIESALGSDLRCGSPPKRNDSFRKEIVISFYTLISSLLVFSLLTKNCHFQ